MIDMNNLPEPTSYFICDFTRLEPIEYNDSVRGDTRIFVDKIENSHIKDTVPKFLLESVETEYIFNVWPCILSSEFYDPYNVDPHIDNKFLDQLDAVLNSPHVNTMQHVKFSLYDFEKECKGETNWEWLCKVWNHMNPDNLIDISTAKKPDYRLLFAKM